MSARFAIASALLLLLAGCGPSVPSTEQVQTLLQDLNRADLTERRQAIENAPGGGLVMAFTDLPRAEEMNVHDVNIVETKEGEDEGVWVTATYKVDVRENTFNQKNSLLVKQVDDEWVVLDGR